MGKRQKEEQEVNIWVTCLSDECTGLMSTVTTADGKAMDSMKRLS